MRVLNVAEKNDAAKNIALCANRGPPNRREGLSQYNKIYEFQYQINGHQCTMIMTSVSGHLLTQDFSPQYRQWQSCPIVELFDAPLQTICPPNYQNIKRTLEREARTCQQLIIWTDCDREGENIGYEVIEVCRAANPRLGPQHVWRARFSEITPQAVNNALRNLVPPDERISNAVACRSELDLRIGAAFTRLMTMRFREIAQYKPFLNEKGLLSYGSCQFPTLGFVVERYKEISRFIREDFWKIKVTHEFKKPEKARVEFHWQRVRLFDQLCCEVIFDICKERPEATVTGLTEKPKSKWRPLPMDTIELEKLASRMLKINAKETMRIAEKLYSQGLISYPRTETNIFPKDFGLPNLVQQQIASPVWGAFAQNLLQLGPNPRAGKKSDQAHPPIHPLKFAPNLAGNEKRVYELIVRHFLATCSGDAKGFETILTIQITEEFFQADGLVITERNYLDVYPYDKWEAKTIPHCSVGLKFIPTRIEMAAGQTSPPALLSESDLIALMEKHGIGTDATHAEHIETIQTRQYAGMNDDRRFTPGRIGMGLVDGYDAIDRAMSRPHLRSQLEASLKDICEGRRNKADVLQEQIDNYRGIFLQAQAQIQKLRDALDRYTQ
ncbi:DNA topoisomerase 3-alpha [Hypsibius exemplaris]|uniref:DNA topoisomerase n=1 Tax=Hypsibius exemplaris TaxID=2072580 RepID=A0A9X6NGK4_HYPEX|nr:DNA topoisomerase 3-alpha [Hypsibius exemplaris]